MRILCVDPGSKRLGLAISDPLGLTAQGLTVIDATHTAAALEEIEALCRTYGVEKIIVGNPLNMNGSRGPAAEGAAQLARKLGHETGLAVELVDERLTSRRAEQEMIRGGLKRQKRRQIRDKLAAVMILETYLQSSKHF